ncbi:MAG: hypothetical protein ACI8O8_003198 [Oleiphilaceae bacterium]|jgi:hypothetical protein
MHKIIRQPQLFNLPRFMELCFSNALEAFRLTTEEIYEKQ